MTKLNCYYYKIVYRPTGKICITNFGWAPTFKELAKNHSGGKFDCFEITKEEFHKLREQESRS